MRGGRAPGRTSDGRKHSCCTWRRIPCGPAPARRPTPTAAGRAATATATAMGRAATADAAQVPLQRRGRADAGTRAAAPHAPRPRPRDDLAQRDARLGPHGGGRGSVAVLEGHQAAHQRLAFAAGQGATHGRVVTLGA